MLKIDHINPQWNIEDFKKLQYKKDVYKGSELLKCYIDHGHDPESLTLYNYFEPNPMPDSVENYIRPRFSFLKNVTIAVNLFKVGKFVPQHNDRYDRYKNFFNLSSIDNIVRYIIMLENGEPGQILEIDDKCYTKWKAGDCFGWKNITKHAFYNFSLKDRYAIQITGVYE